MRATIFSSQRLPRWLPIGLGAAVLIGAALLALTLFRPAPASTLPSGDVSQVSQAGQVTVKATWRVGEGAPTFAIALDTHSVALDGYDLRALATLRVDGREVAPRTWDAPAGGHHRSGTLVFPATADDGSPLLTSQTRHVELVIRDIGDAPERVLTWER